MEVFGIAFTPQQIGTFERLAQGPRDVARLNSVSVEKLAARGFVETDETPGEPVSDRRKVSKPIVVARLTDEGLRIWEAMGPRLRK